MAKTKKKLTWTLDDLTKVVYAQLELQDRALKQIEVLSGLIAQLGQVQQAQYAEILELRKKVSAKPGKYDSSIYY